MQSDMVFHSWIGGEKQLSIKVEKGMAGKYSHAISFGGSVEDRDKILSVIDEIDRALTERYSSERAA